MWREPLKSFGAVHIAALIGAFVMLQLGAFIGRKYRYEDYKKEITKAIGIIGLVFLALQIHAIIRRTMTEGFKIGFLPYQICTMDFFLFLIFPLFKKENLKKSIVSFAAFISLVGATFYFVKPATALNTLYIDISLNTIIWHWLVIASGSFCITSFNLNKFENIRYFFGSIILFVVLVIIAIILNCICNALGVDAYFFYINSIKPTFYPLLNLIFRPDPKPYVLFVISFILYFSIGATVFFLLSVLQGKWFEKRLAKKASR